MNKAVLLFPKQVLAYHVVDYALDWARENEGSLHVIFFLPETVPEEGYSYPSDIDQAQMLKDIFDAEAGYQDILQSELRYIEKRAGARHIPVEFEILHSPTVEDIIRKSEDAELIFMDKFAGDEVELFEDLRFSAEELREKMPRIFEVSEYDKYSDVFY